MTEVGGCPQQPAAPYHHDNNQSFPTGVQVLFSFVIPLFLAAFSYEYLLRQCQFRHSAFKYTFFAKRFLFLSVYQHLIYKNPEFGEKWKEFV